AAPSPPDMQRPPPHTPFPYTTLFRSQPKTPPPEKKGRAGSDIHQCRLVITVRNPFAPNDTCVRSAGQLKGEFTNAKPHCLAPPRSEEHTSELQSRFDLVCRLLLEKKK